LFPPSIGLSPIASVCFITVSADLFLSHSLVSICLSTRSYGGRLQSKSFGTAGYVELGGTWIHGADERNAVYRLAQSYGLVDSDAELFDRKLGLFHGLNGSIDQSLAGEVYEALKDIEYDAMHLPETDKRSMGKSVSLPSQNRLSAT